MLLESKYPRLVRNEKLVAHPQFAHPVLAVRTGWQDEYGFVKWEPGVEYVQIPRPSTSVCVQDAEC